jgi:hypothetical protein
VVSFTLPARTDLTMEWAQVGSHVLALYRDDNARLACEANSPVSCTSLAGQRMGTSKLVGLDAGKYFLVVDADRAGSEGGVILQLSGLPTP